MSFKACANGHVLFAMMAVLACKRETTAPATTAGELAVTSAGEVPAGGSGPADTKVEPPGDASAGGEPATTDAATTGDVPVEPPAATTDPPPGDTKSPVAAAPGLPEPLHTKIDGACGKDPGVGSPAHAFALKTADGKEISLASLRGKVVLLNFWGTWCKPCLKELPEFDRLVRHYRKQGAVLVAIATDTEPEKVLEFGQSRKIAGKLVLGGEELAKKYDSPNFPFSFVVDAQGVVRGSYRSYRPECIGKIEQDLRTSLEQRKR